MPLTAPTLAVTDDADGGGYSASVAGGDASATNTLYAVRYTNLIDGFAWASAGSRVGPGAITGTMAAGAGYYFWHVQSVLSSESVLSGVVHQNLTDDDTALHEQVLEAVLSTVQLLELPGMAQVVRRKVNWADLMLLQLEMPAVVVSSFEQTETPLGGTNAQNDRGLPVYVMFLTKDARENENEARWHLWRQMVWRAFHNCRLSGVADVMNCEVQAAQVILADERKIELQYGGFLIQAHTRENRGFGA